MEPTGSGLAATAHQLVVNAERDPHRTRAEGTALVESARAGRDLRAESLAHRAVGVASRVLGEIPAALDALDHAVECGRQIGDPVLEGEARTSRAAARFLNGDAAGCFSDLDVAVETLTGESLAFALFQRATVLNRCGEREVAKAGYDEALNIAEHVDARKYQAHVRANRALLRAYDGEFAAAEEDLRIAASLYNDLGLTSLAAVTTHNLGFVAARRGDFVAALTHFNAARQTFAALRQPLGALALDECEALLDVGLATEAVQRAKDVVAEVEAQHNEVELAEAHLMEAVAHLHTGELTEAAAMAKRALQGFRRQQRHGWPEAADLLLLRIGAAEGQLTSKHVRVARDLVSRFRQTGHSLLAAHAELLAAQAVIATGDAAAALDAVSALRWHTPTLPVEIALHASAIEAEAWASAGRTDQADAAVTAGVDLLERHHIALGACDVRASISTHASRLFRVGRRLAYGARDAEALFGRIEQSRANALRHRLHPPMTGEGARLLTALRTVTAAVRTSNSASEAAELEQRRLLLERDVTDHYWRTKGDRRAGRQIAIAAEIVERLDDESMVVLAEIDEQLTAVVVEDRPRLVSIGPIQPVIDCADGLTLSLRRLARRGPDATAADRDLETIQQLANNLEEQVVRPLGVARQRWIIVPPARLHHTAWSLTPTLHAAAFTVVPSATSWLGAQIAAPTTSDQHVLVAGPRLRHAAGEVEQLAQSMPTAHVLVGSKATAVNVLEAAEGAALVHIAAHYLARRENPMLSSIELHDGDLYLQDIAQLSHAPDVVVLSTCNSAAAAVHAGDEIVGIGAAFLQLGTRSVLATSNLLPDTVITIDFANRLHNGLRAGQRPSAALAEARLATAQQGPTASAIAGTFLCLGRG